MKDISLYIHIPFCKSKCLYCDFLSYSGKEVYIDDYIKALINEIVALDVYKRQEKEFIQNVFEFDDTDVGEICTHRKEVEILWDEDDMTEWENTINNSRHSKYPICKDNADNVIGILDVKDYFRTKDKSRENVMKTCVEEPQFVLETTKADVMFEKMKKSRNYFAVVLDEYGGMCGIVTLNDLVQQIMGELVDEDEENHYEDIERMDDLTWRILGEASIKDVCEELGVSISDDEYDTFGGFIFGCLGSIPDAVSYTHLDVYKRQPVCRRQCYLLYYAA